MVTEIIFVHRNMDKKMNMNALFMRINLNIVYGTQESIIFFLKWRQFIDFAIYKFVVARKIRLTRRFSLFC